MKLKYLLPILAVIGFIFASYKVVSSNKPTPVAPAVVEPASAPFKAFIAGSGIIEAKSRNVALGSPLSGVVDKVLVNVGDKIKAGTPVFSLDDRESKAQWLVKKAALGKAESDVEVAQANLADSRSLSQMLEAVSDKRAISHEELVKRRNTLAIAKANLLSTEAGVAQAKAALADAQTTLERLVIKAPMDCEVLQVNIRPGEFAQAGTLNNTPLVVLGNLEQLHVRVDIDENDAWRFDKTKPAVAYLRGNRSFKVELGFAYVEPFVVPKKSLTGDSTERVDTRVLQALYSFDRGQLAVYVGQQMDVFIEAQEYANGEGTVADNTSKEGAL